MAAPGRIRNHNIVLPLGARRIDWSWEGNRVIAWAADEALYFSGTTERVENGMVVHVGPYRVRVIDREPSRKAYLVAREGWRARLYYVTYRLAHSLDGAYRRIILTLHVWGLADFDYNHVPTWRDITLFRRKH